LRVGWLPPSHRLPPFQEVQTVYTGTLDTQVRLVAPDTSYAANATLSPDALVNATPIPNPNDVLIRFGTSLARAPASAAGSTIHAAVLELTSINAMPGCGGDSTAS